MKTINLHDISVNIVKDQPRGLIAHKINSLGREEKDDAFYICDLGDIVKKYKLWYSQLPRVTPFYAVKCNDDPAVLRLLAQLGTGFDCASKSEIQKVLDMKVAPSRIVYANPCKQQSHIRYATKHNVSLMTFDNEVELHKVKAAFPNARLVLRILPPESTKVQCPLGIKFGAHPKSATKLLNTAKELGLDVVGVSFHVGSGCYDATAFSAAVASARTVFDIGREVGYSMELLDIGGGFPGQHSAKISFEEICGSLRPALDLYFPESMGVRLIAEPGRFFVASAFTLAVNIIAKRSIPGHLAAPHSDEEEGGEESGPMFMYYVNDGVYGSFNCLLYDHAEVQACLLHPENYVGERTYTSSIWGPTCDGLDCIVERCWLPELYDGDWMVFSDMGAYTVSAASGFNGMPKPRCFYTMHEHTWLQVEDACGQTAGCQLSALSDKLLNDHHHHHHMADIISDAAYA